MRVSGLGRGRRVELPAILCVLVMTAVLVGCGGGGETTAPAADGEATPLKRNLSGATVEAGTPAAKAGTPDVPPIPSQIGDCVIEPKTECPGADLRGAGLGFRSFGFGAGVRAKLAGANLQGADLTGADLFSADLASADLRRANLTDANLAGADLFQADLQGADLTGADLSFADLEEARLDGATFCNTTMPDATVNSESCP